MRIISSRYSQGIIIALPSRSFIKKIDKELWVTFKYKITLLSILMKIICPQIFQKPKDIISLKITNMMLSLKDQIIYLLRKTEAGELIQSIRENSTYKYLISPLLKIREVSSTNHLKKQLKTLFILRN